jgi:hypothetical protein
MLCKIGNEKAMYKCEMMYNTKMHYWATKGKLGVVVHIYNPSTWEAEAGGPPELQYWDPPSKEKEKDDVMMRNLVYLLFCGVGNRSRASGMLGQHSATEL